MNWSCQNSHLRERGCWACCQETASGITFLTGCMHMNASGSCSMINLSQKLQLLTSALWHPPIQTSLPSFPNNTLLSSQSYSGRSSAGPVTGSPSVWLVPESVCWAWKQAWLLFVWVLYYIMLIMLHFLAQYLVCSLAQFWSHTRTWFVWTGLH